MSQWAALAANTQLPPSPEIKSQLLEDPFTNQQEPSRLRSIAKYDSFQPQALACSPPVAASYSDTEIAAPYAARSRNIGARSSECAPYPSSASVSLGALAGAQGVAVFRVNRPHIPLFMLSQVVSSTSLSYATVTTTDSSSTSFHNTNVNQIVSSLAFQQSTFANTFFLAAARGSSALIWDVSGHSLSPLRGRLCVDSGTMHDREHSRIRSLIWKPESEWLAATTAYMACLWDVREPPSSSSNMFKPSLRFGVTRKSRGTGSAAVAPNVQVACSNKDECAVMDASGQLRVFDMRQTERVRANSGALYSANAFQHAGVGVSYLPSESRNSATWLTWGLDYATSKEAAVRIWTSSDASNEGNRETTDEYWYMNGSPDPDRSLDGSLASAGQLGCRMLAQCRTRNLACVRVCPELAMKDSFVTVGFDGGNLQSGWYADLWQLQKSVDEGTKSSLQNTLSIRGGKEEKALEAMVNGARLGALCGAELAMAAQHTAHQAKSSAGEGSPELLLCCLSDGGFVTTHAIFEVQRELAGDKSEPRHSVLDNTTSLRVFPPKKENALNDAARFWNKQGDAKSDSVDVRTIVESGEAGISGGATMPFDMDVPVAYGMIGVSGVPIGGVNEPLPDVAATDDDNERAKQVAREAAMLMNKIEKDRIPCPRLCGATFSPGVGGMAVFNNGAVRKMWQWWDKNDQNRMAAASTTVLEPSVLVLDPSDGELSESAPTQTLVADCPRTLQDLVDMLAAAKEAQWGEQDGSDDSSVGFRRLTGKFFEDGSDGSSDSGEDETEVDFSENAQKDMYDSYFSDTKRPLIESQSLDVSSDENFGPSSDMLSPFVGVSRTFDKLALNSQSQALAKGWRLGFSFQSAQRFEEERSMIKYQAVQGDVPQLPTGSNPSKSMTSLPRYRFLVPLADGKYSAVQGKLLTDRVPRAVSESMMNGMQNKAMIDRRMGVSPESDLERGVHNGEYSVRPNMQESMVFLKKLFTQQHHEGGSAAPRSSMFSPPDSPMLPNSLSNNHLSRRGPSRRIVSLPNVQAPPRKVQGGVSVLRASNPDPGSRVSKVLLDISEICLCNASVSESLGENSKRDTWKLLSKAVESRVKNNHTFSGDWGRSGDALGTNLVRNFLHYYESLGDIQMLSTIVCVLRHPLLEKHPSFKILPAGKDEQKYDFYIRKYADLLYAWGLLNMRAELTKHLTHVPSQTTSLKSSNHQDGVDGNQSTGISLAFRCPRCSNDVLGQNYCQTCKSYAFRCIICDNAVRGLFTVCHTCGHGGHVQHLMSWFSSNDSCPTGCGCQCVFLTTPSQSHVEAHLTKNSDELSV